MFEFIFRKILPFALARTMSLAAIPLLQFALIIFSSKAEAGKFFFISNAAFVVSQIADMGMAKAFPVLFGSRDNRTHPQLPEIIITRIILGFFGGLIFIIFNQFGEIAWSWQGAGLAAFFFCVGRVVLLGNQGYRHARQEYSSLLRGSIVHFLSAMLFIIICASLQSFNANVALAALAIGVWIETIVIDSSQAHPIAKSNNEFRLMFKTAWPFMALGVANSIYVRIDSLVAGRFFSPELLGVYGTLDSALKLCIWPSYVSAQAVYPGMNEAVNKTDKQELELAKKRHFKLGGAVCVSVMVIGALVWYLKFYAFNEVTLAALFLWLSLWMAIPNAFMIPLFYSLGLEAKLNKIMLKLAFIRIFLAIFLALNFKIAGLCANHTIITLIAITMLYKEFYANQPPWLSHQSAEAKE
ncbi:MAG: lipopolysaccharide biosynthesis protein [Candidatus Rifleibacteriota bacterium]